MMKRFFYRDPSGEIYESVFSGINVQTNELWVCLKSMKDYNKRYIMPFTALHNQRLVDGVIIPDYKPLSDDEIKLLLDEIYARQQDVRTSQLSYRTENKDGQYKPYTERTTKGRCWT